MQPCLLSHTLFQSSTCKVGTVQGSGQVYRLVSEEEFRLGLLCVFCGSIPSLAGLWLKSLQLSHWSLNCSWRGAPNCLGHSEGAKDVTGPMFSLARVKQRPLETRHFETFVIFYLLFIILERFTYLLLSIVGQRLERSFVSWETQVQMFLFSKF